VTSDQDIDTPEDRSGDTAGRRGGKPRIWSPPDVMRLLMALAHNFVWLVIAPIVGLGMTVAYLLLNDPSYSVGSQLMVRFGQELSAPATVSATGSQQVVPMSKRVEDITAEVQIMKDPAIIREVVATLGEDFFYGEDEAVTLLQKIKKAIKDTIQNTKEGVRNLLVRVGLLTELSRLDRVVLLLQNSITINHVTRSDVIELSLGYPDPRLGEVVLQTFLDTYLAKRLEIFQDERVTEFLETELTQVRDELEARREDYAALSERNRIWMRGEQQRLLVSEHQNLLSELEEVESTIEVTNARIARIEAALDEAPEFVPASTSVRRNQVLDDLQVKLIELRLEAESARNRSGVRSQQTRSLNEQIARLEEIIAGEPERIVDSEVEEANPLRATLLAQRADAELTLSSAIERAENLRSSIAETETELERMSQIGLELQREASEIERLESTLDRYRRAVDDARINSGVADARISNVVVIAAPDGGVAPTSPRVVRLLAISIVLSIIAVSAVILIVDALRPKVRNNADILDFVPEGTLVRAMAESRRRA
jgi:uncharacterized protein involved in exopolysaccharide biosynthesis